MSRFIFALTCLLCLLLPPRLVYRAVVKGVPAFLHFCLYYSPLIITFRAIYALTEGKRNNSRVIEEAVLQAARKRTSEAAYKAGKGGKSRK